MKIGCVVPPLHLPVNEIGHGYHPPLGLLAIAGPLVDAGYSVRLFDADAGYHTIEEIIWMLQDFGTQIVLIGHSGSIAANPSVLELLRAIKASLPKVSTVYGGVYATFAHQELLKNEPALDYIICGEGESTTLELVQAIEDSEQDFTRIKGLAWRTAGRIICNPPRLPHVDLDQFRIAWELADWSLYESHHLPGRTAILQFSRGCPNSCSYCGQWMFWQTWRHRRIDKFLEELQFLRDRFNVRTVWIADENWGCSEALFKDLLKTLVNAKTGIQFFCAMCAGDVVRDAEILNLYREAGIVCLMMGVESFDDTTLQRIGKNNPYKTVVQAVKLLQKHNILSVVNVIYGLRSENWKTLWQVFWQLKRMGPDFFNALHLTPLEWTAEGQKVSSHQIIQFDQRKWDFRQPVIQPDNFSPRTLGLIVKAFEAMFYFRPVWILRNLFFCAPIQKRIMRDSLPRMVRVHWHECWELLRNKYTKPEANLTNTNLSLTEGSHYTVKPPKPASGFPALHK